MVCLIVISQLFAFIKVNTNIIYSDKIFINDPVFVVKCIPSISGRVISKQGANVIFDVKYTTDSYGRRFTPDKNINNNHKYAVFLGCSYVFGIGLNDWETLPACFNVRNSDYKAYNYGMPGYGTNHLLRLLSTKSFQNEVPERNGIAFYVYIEDHIRRSLGSVFDFHKPLPAWGPYYKLINGEPVYQGTFENKRPIVTKLNKFLTKIAILRLFDDFPKITARDYEFQIKMIQKMKEGYRQKFKNDNFYVVIHPLRSDNRYIIPYLIRHKIKYIDLGYLIPSVEESYNKENVIIGDDHPTFLLNQKIATELVKYINKGLD